MKNNLLNQLREGQPLSLQERIMLIIELSIPAMLAQVSSIVMQYIDASMVGQLGANDSASIGLVSTSTWLFGGVINAAVIGFTVQVAQSVGAEDMKTARNIMKQAFLIVVGIALFIALGGALLSFPLPHLLGGAEEICRNASRYFLVYALSLPFVALNNLAGGMLQSSGNMKVPSLLHVLMCGLDVLFNMLLIFPKTNLFGITIPGVGLGVTGAALGTALSQVVTAMLMLYFLLVRSPMLRLHKNEKFVFSKIHMKQAVSIAVPVGFESVVTSGAQVIITRIVSPLGTIAIAANSFAVTAESLCYMPGYGIGAAATTLIGQSIGAKRHDLTLSLGWLTTFLGMIVMSITGILMYLMAPWVIGLLSPNAEIVKLGAEVLRIEALAEPLFAASIVASGVFRGAGDTFIPSCLNFFSMWAVRIPLSAILAPRLGLHGVWIGMCLELCVRGTLFLIRLYKKKWLKKSLA